MDCISLCYEARGGPHQTDQYSNYHYLHLICWKQRAQLADIQLSRTHSTEPNFNRGKFSTFHLCMHSMWERMNLLLIKKTKCKAIDSPRPMSSVRKSNYLSVDIGVIFRCHTAHISAKWIPISRFLSDFELYFVGACIRSIWEMWLVFVYELVVAVGGVVSSSFDVWRTCCCCDCCKYCRVIVVVGCEFVLLDSIANL